VFDHNIKHKARRKYQLLILDIHVSHVTPACIQYCDRNRILHHRSVALCMYAPTYLYAHFLSSLTQRNHPLSVLKARHCFNGRTRPAPEVRLIQLVHVKTRPCYGCPSGDGWTLAK
jgi:hypothetical protein